MLIFKLHFHGEIRLYQPSIPSGQTLPISLALKYSFYCLDSCVLTTFLSSHASLSPLSLHTSHTDLTILQTCWHSVSSSYPITVLSPGTFCFICHKFSSLPHLSHCLLYFLSFVIPGYLLKIKFSNYALNSFLVFFLNSTHNHLIYHWLFPGLETQEIREFCP